MTSHRLKVQQTVLDATDARRLAEFYRELLDLHYRTGDEPPPSGEPDPRAQDWLVLRGDDCSADLAFQPVDDLPPATWPDGPHPQQLHLDLTVDSVEGLELHHRRALDLGATLLLDESDDPDEQLYVYADPAGHPFCIFVA